MEFRVVKTENGLLQGVPCGNPAYTVYKGVPFAKPPVGDLRWRAPQPAESWAGTKKCDTFPPISVQTPLAKGEFYQKEFFPFQTPMSEDCLYLNVWVPADTDSINTKKLPVMVWLHGGAYMQGYSYEMEFDGEAFCRRKVILVTVTYRLGILGYFAHPELTARSEKNVSGNYGLLDQIEALKWVKKNISAFGGDPGNVTVFGQSAGGGSVQAIMASPLSQGLFQKAIVQSAGGIRSLSGRYTLSEAEQCGQKATDRIGMTIDELLRMPAEELQNKVMPAIDNDKLYLSPVIDGYVLPIDAGDAIALGKVPDIPYLTGTVSGDGLLFDAAPEINSEKEYRQFVKKRYGKYFDRYQKLFDNLGLSDYKKILELRQQAAAKIVPLTWAKMQNKIGRTPAYIYHFNRDIPGVDHPGAFHSSELWYIFGTVSRCWRPMQAVDYQISMQMTDYWTNFAKTGDPNGEGLPQWRSYTEANQVLLEINENHIGEKELSQDQCLNAMSDLMLQEVCEELKL